MDTEREAYRKRLADMSQKSQRARELEAEYNNRLYSGYRDMIRSITRELASDTEDTVAMSYQDFRGIRVVEMTIRVLSALESAESVREAFPFPVKSDD